MAGRRPPIAREDRINVAANYLERGERILDHGLARWEEMEQGLGRGMGQGFLLATDRGLVFYGEQTQRATRIPYQRIQGHNYRTKALTAELSLTLENGETSRFNGGKGFLSGLRRLIDSQRGTEVSKGGGGRSAGTPMASALEGRPLGALVRQPYVEAPSAARILDRRYQRYEGPRKGEAHAARRLGVHSFQRLLGIRRSARYKIVPALLAVACFILPMAFIAIAAFLPAGQLIAQLEYGLLFQLIGIPVLLFVVLTGPGNLIADRASKSLSLYLASPLTRTTYLIAHAGAVVTVLSLVTVGPALFYLIATVLQGAGPEGFVGFASLTGKILLAGGFLAVYFTALTMVAGAFTDRPGIAAGAIFLGLQIIDSLGLFLSERLNNDVVRLIGIGDVPDQLVNRIFNFTQLEQFAFDLATPFIVAGAFFWIVVGFGATWWRYQRLVVSR